MHGSKFHGNIDLGGRAVDSATEDVGEAEHVDDLVGIVAAACGIDEVFARLHSLVVGNFGIRIGQGKDDGLVGHRLHHLGSDHIGNREAQEDVGPLHGLGQGCDIACGGKLLLLRVEVGATCCDDALAVAHHDVFLLHAQLHVETGAAYCCGASTVYHELDVACFLALYIESVDEACT